jgi:hypothetical protein
LEAALAESANSTKPVAESEPVAFAYYWPPTNTLRRNPAYRLEWGPTTVWKAEVPLYTNPPRREWRSLSGEEIRDLWSWSATAEAERTATTQQHAFAHAIEAALKERNA